MKRYENKHFRDRFLEDVSGIKIHNYELMILVSMIHYDFIEYDEKMFEIYSYVFDSFDNEVKIDLEDGSNHMHVFINETLGNFKIKKKINEYDDHILKTIKSSKSRKEQLFLFDNSYIYFKSDNIIEYIPLVFFTYHRVRYDNMYYHGYYFAWSIGSDVDSINKSYISERQGTYVLGEIRNRARKRQLSKLFKNKK